MLAVWLLTILALGPFIGKFEGAQQNEPSSFLPGRGGVRARPGGVEGVPARGRHGRRSSSFATPTGSTGVRRRVVRKRQAFAETDIPGAEATSPPVPSDDGTGAIVTVPIAAGGDEEC